MTTRVGGFRAMKLGFRVLWRDGGTWGFGFASGVAVGACRLALGLAALASAIGAFLRGIATADTLSIVGVVQHGFAAAVGARFWTPLLGAWLCVELLGAVLRVVYVAAAVANGSAGLSAAARPREPVLRAALPVFSRATVASLLLVIIEWTLGLCQWVLIGAALLVFFHAVGARHGGGMAAFWGALGLTLAVALGLAVSLFGRVFLVRAIRGGRAGVAAWEAGALLGRRLGTYLLIAVLGLGLALAGSMVTGSPGLLASLLGPGHPLIGLGLRALSGVLEVAWTSALGLILIGAVCAVDLDQAGELPQPPAPPPPPEPVVLEAREIVLAQAIEPEAG